MKEAGKTLSRVHEEKEEKQEKEEEEEEDAKGTRSGAWRRDRGGWTEGWLAVSE